MEQGGVEPGTINRFGSGKENELKSVTSDMKKLCNSLL